MTLFANFFWYHVSRIPIAYGMRPPFIPVTSLSSNGLRMRLEVPLEAPDAIGTGRVSSCG